MEMSDGMIGNMVTEMIVNSLLIAGAVSAALYCRALARRLSALKDPANGLGAAISTLSRQVDVLRDSIEQARVASGEQTRSLTQMTARAEMASGRLELLLAALHENGRERPIDKNQVEARRRVRAETMAEAMVEARAEIGPKFKHAITASDTASDMARDRVEVAARVAARAAGEDYADPPFVAHGLGQSQTQSQTRNASRQEAQMQG